MTGWRTALFSMLIASAACSTDFTPQQCSEDGDCGTGLVCELRETKPACVNASDAPLTIGESAPVSGTNQALGTAMKLGIDRAFDEKNAIGGIRGRMLKLSFRDDAYQPQLAEAAAKALVDVQVASTTPRCPSTATKAMFDQVPQPVSTTRLNRGPNAVLAILGNVGTPTMLRSAPVAIETGTVFFGAFTGSSTILRDSEAGDECSRFIFNVRASYSQEAQATMEYFVTKRHITDSANLISFDQNDSFGQSGYDGLIAAYKNTVGPFPSTADPTKPIHRARYERNDDTSVPTQVTDVENYLDTRLHDNPLAMEIHIGIMMTDTYGAGAQFIQALRTWQYTSTDRKRLKLWFSNVSFVGANSLSDQLKAAGAVPGAPANTFFTDDVVISQVVPNYQSDSSEVVTSYNKLIKDNGDTPSFTSLEGYIAARVFIAGLELHKGPFTADSIVDSFEGLPDLGLGIGATSGFSTKNHQYSNSVWGTVLQPDGSFKNLYFWSVGIPIDFF